MSRLNLFKSYSQICDVRIECYTLSGARLCARLHEYAIEGIVNK